MVSRNAKFSRLLKFSLGEIGVAYVYVCAHALDSTQPRPGTLTLDHLIFSYNYNLIIIRACLRFCCLSIPSIVVLVQPTIDAFIYEPTKGVLEPPEHPLATP